MVARRAHNPKVSGSNPLPATTAKPVRPNERLFLATGARASCRPLGYRLYAGPYRRRPRVRGCLSPRAQRRCQHSLTNCRTKDSAGKTDEQIAPSNAALGVDRSTRTASPSCCPRSRDASCPPGNERDRLSLDLRPAGVPESSSGSTRWASPSPCLTSYLGVGRPPQARLRWPRPVHQLRARRLRLRPRRSSLPGADRSRRLAGSTRSRGAGRGHRDDRRHAPRHCLRPRRWCMRAGCRHREVPADLEAHAIPTWCSTIWMTPMR